MHPFPSAMVGLQASTAVTTWDSAFNTHYTYSNGNRTITGTADEAGRGTTARSTGKWYFEVKCSSIGSAGIILDSQTGLSYPGINNGANGCMVYNYNYYGKNGLANLSGMSGRTIGVAVDLDAKTIQFFQNGVQLLSDSIVAGAMRPALDCAAGGTMTINCGQDLFAYAPPTGFNAWG